MRHRSITAYSVVFVALLAGANRAPGQSQNSPIDPSVAAQYFLEAKAACTQDGGKLWGMSLCGPVLFVDPATRAVVANQSDAEGLLVKKDEVFLGRLPDRLPVANAYVNWGGVRWTMIIWPSLTPDRFQRVKLMMHESYHRIQNELKFSVHNAANDHLDSRDGRFWLQLEWRALRRALTSQGAARRQAVEDALTFRAYRRSLFAPTSASERVLEINEGLAEYTGFRLSAKTNAELLDYLTRQIERAAENPTFVGSFAYSSGPAYGILLDTAAAGWRQGLTPQDDLGELLQRSLRIELSSDVRARAEKQAGQYGGEALRLAEAERETARQKRIAEYRKRLVEGPTLLLSLTDKRTVSFNSTNIVPLEGVGTVYPTARVSDEWGILEISNGALMVREGGRITKVYVPSPADVKTPSLKGDGWVLQLNPDWLVVPGQRPGDYLVRRRE